MSLKRIYREPLLHFLLIGATLFIAYNLANEEGNVAPNRIVVNSGQIEQLSANFKRTRMRAPTEAEMAALIESHIREEVFYREALAMGLDQDDPQVRRRMRMKLEYILEDISSQNVSDEALTLFMHEHPDKFKTDIKIAFQQVYLNPEKRENITADIEKSLLLLNNGTSPDTLGDPILIPFNNKLSTQDQIARSFGDDFARDVTHISSKDWTGPIYSSYGVHLVKIDQRLKRTHQALSEIRALVEREYLVEKRKEQKELAYQQLRQSYEVNVESRPIKVE